MPFRLILIKFKLYSVVHENVNNRVCIPCQKNIKRWKLKHSNVSLIFENMLCAHSLADDKVTYVYAGILETGVRYYLFFSSLTRFGFRVSFPPLSIISKINIGHLGENTHSLLSRFFFFSFFLIKQILFSWHLDNLAQFTYRKKHSNVCDCERNEFNSVHGWKIDE